MKAKKKRRLLLLIAILAILAYQYPVQKFLASKKFEAYLTAQGVSREQIESEEMIKDWKQGGYLVIVIFQDDPNYKYYYHYGLWTHHRGENLKFHQMSLEIIDIQKSMVLDEPYEGKCKYPPISE
ncbi:DUF3139 domain-containing protein [Falseniella ignava]|uniref:DUF3139 domain-containing protein n=1 Tax=Falseniella ignava CCUG 37419 TaxID=883112 RepID=K1M8B1_9LACT|nr:DUF3139 domain-containing protein [Falseniella ignava]EKB58603.1 hypothetical protein HMPREF9707_00228 [Falseniella ignava CCUG 37419]